jgi:hypothetical protein
MADGWRMTARAVRKPVARVWAILASVRQSVAASRRSAMMGKARRAGVSDVPGMADMSASPRVDSAAMRAASVTHMHAAVWSETAKMPATDVRRPAVRHPSAAKMRRAATTTAKVRTAAAATTKVRGTAAAKMGGAATTPKVRPTATTAKVRTAAATTTTTTTTTKVRRGDCQRKAGNADGQSGRQSGNNPTRHSITPTV